MVVLSRPTRREEVAEITEGFKARLEYVLDQVCADLPAGGNHEARQTIAAHLLKAAQNGVTNIDDLTQAGRQVLCRLRRGGK